MEEISSKHGFHTLWMHKCTLHFCNLNFAAFYCDIHKSTSAFKDFAQRYGCEAAGNQLRYFFHLPVIYFLRTLVSDESETSTSSSANSSNCDMLSHFVE